MLLVADDRLLAEVIVAAGGHRLVPALVDAWPVPRLVGVVPCLAFGRVQALVLPAPVAGFRAVTVPVFPSVHPVHLRSPFHCADGMPTRRAARESMAMAVSTTHGFAALTFRRPVSAGPADAAGLASASKPGWQHALVEFGVLRRAARPRCRTAFDFRSRGRRNMPIERSLLCCLSSRSCC